MELYTHLPNRIGLHLIEFEQFNHVDFLYSRNVSELVYQSVINTITTAESFDWAPVYDNKTSYNAFLQKQCNDVELSERSSRKNNNGFWSKMFSYIKKKEVPSLTKLKEENIQYRNKYQNTWNETYNLR